MVKWIERAVFEEGFVPPEVRVHSASVAARKRMQRDVACIELQLLRRTLIGGA